jgi:hypothetical protein
MTARSVALRAALVLTTACGSSHSQYARQAASPGELVWRFDDQLQVTRDGQLVAQAGSWDGLAAAVACVPRANHWATAATSRYRKGTVTLWTALIGGVVSVAAGSVIAFSNTDHADRAVAGLALISGGLIFGGATAATGAYMHAGASARGIDAVNLYNDEVASGARCAP